MEEHKVEIGIALVVVWLALRFYLMHRSKMRRQQWEERQRAMEEAEARGEMVEDDDMGA